MSLPLPKEDVHSLIGHLNDTTSMDALKQSIEYIVSVFVETHERKPSVLILGSHFGVLAFMCSKICSHMTIVCPYEAEQSMIERYLTAHGLTSEHYTVLNKWAVQLPANMGIDMLVMDLFGGFLNAQGASVVAWDLFRRDVVRTHEGGRRYCVPHNGVMTARLYWCPSLSATSIHYNDVCNIGIDPKLPHKWFSESLIPGGLAHAIPISERKVVCSEEYGGDNTPDQAVVSYPSFITFPNTRLHSIAECVVVLEWLVLLDDRGKYVMGTSLGILRDTDMPIQQQVARMGAWPRPCMALSALTDSTDELTLSVNYKIQGTVSLTKVDDAIKTNQDNFIPDKMLKTICTNTFAKIVSK